MAGGMHQHLDFWAGRGGSLILIPPCDSQLYDLSDYPRRFFDPQAMWAHEIERARKVIDWPTDGIPSVRANLGVTFIPALAGQKFRLVEGSMPWPGEPLDKAAICAARDIDVEMGQIMHLALEFYRIHRDSGETDVAAYLPDTQGVFDIAHLLRGDELFYELADPGAADWVRELMDVSYLLYERATRLLKNRLGEASSTMIHGHGTAQGVYFPHAGARVSEDTATLLSPQMIRDVVVPSVRRCIEAFGGVFLHFCGRHEELFRQLVALPGVKAVDLGNPEMYALDDVMRWCAESDTVLYSRLPAEPGEDWRSYVRRIAVAMRMAGTRVILRPLVFPDTREECQQMLEMWHGETNT